MGFFINLAGAAAAIATFGICSVLVSPDAWDSATIASIIALTSGSGLIVSAPQIIFGYGVSRTGNIASVGINGIILIIYFILSFISYVMAIKGIDRAYVWASTILSYGWFVVGLMISRASVNYLDDNFPSNSLVSFSIIAQEELSTLQSTCDNIFKKDIDKLVEVIRFSASDLGNLTDIINNQIIVLIRNDLNESVQIKNADKFSDSISKIKHLLALRENRIKIERTKRL